MRLLVLVDILIVYSFIVCIAFVGLYHAVAPWNKTEFGRQLMMAYVVKAVLFGFLTYRIFAPDNEVLAYLRVIVFTFMPVYMTWQLWLLFKIQIRRPSNDDTGDSNPGGMGSETPKG